MWWTKYIGIPFEEKGRTALGADCWGLVRLVYKLELEIDLPSYDELYNDTGDKTSLPALIDQERNHWITPEQPKEFDVIILKMRGVPMHVGVVTKPGFMLHSAEGVNTVHVSFDAMQWKNKVVGFARYE